MAKKARRVRKARSQSRANKNRTNNSDVAVSDKTAVVEKQKSSAEKFQADYAYVIKDLRHILILAVAMFALLIILNLVLQ